MSVPTSRRPGRLSLALRCLAATAVVAVASFAGAPAASADGPLVNGGGSSFVSLLVSQWRADVAKPPYNLGINYAATGSTFGRDKYITGALDFGQSDIQFLDDEQARLQASGRGNFVYVPIAAGAVAFMFNLAGTDGKRITDLNLTPDAACKIFTVPDIRWTDPSIAGANPGAKLPDRPVIPVVRQDRSGTSYVLSEFCIRRAPGAWNAFKTLNAQGSFNPDERLNRGLPITQWSTGYGKVQSAQASDGIANVVANSATGRDSITYIETGYTKVKGLPAAKVQNPAGVFTPPLPANSTIALGFATPRGNGTFELSYDGGDPRAYFPSTYSYAIAQTTGFDPAKGKVLATYLNYAACKGQDRAEPLLYSRLSSVLVDIALDATAKIPGAPPRPPTATCSAPPPPSLQNAPAKAAAAAGAGAGAAGAGAAGAAGAGAAGAAADAAAQAAAADAAAADAAAAQAAEVAGASEEAAADAATGAAGGSGAVAGQNVGSSSGGPENSDVLFTLLLGAALVAVGTFAAKGGRSAVGRP
ncbi:MAG: substrate-binding domain-containing protein [Microthrixaceae bacterium]